MFERTSTDDAPWTIIRSNDKKRGRLNAMRHVLNVLPYEGKDPNLDLTPDPLLVGSPDQILLDADARDVVDDQGA